MRSSGRYQRRRSTKSKIINAVAVIAIVSAVAAGGKIIWDGMHDKKDITMQNGKDIETDVKIPSTEGETTEGSEAEIESTSDIPTPSVDINEPEAYEDISKNIDLSGLTGYQAQYPGHYAEKQKVIPVESKTVYLTFDDGPSKNTAAVLDALDRCGVKATFFVVTGGKSDELVEENLKAVAERGHNIGIHTYSHKYDEIYQSVDTFLEDIDKVNRKVYEITGKRCSVYRFPGGSKNSYNKAVRDDIKAEMERRGFTAFDWNSSTQDAEGKKFTADQLADNAISTFYDRKRVVVLAHDGPGQKVTPDSIEKIVNYAKENGYTFGVLDNSCGELVF